MIKMIKMINKMLLGLATLGFCGGLPVIAQTAQTAQTQQETPKAEFGFEQRVRNENWDNILDYNDAKEDQRIQVRYRTRAWAKIPLGTDLDFYAGLGHETNEIVKPRGPFRFDEVFVEHLYLDFKKFLTNDLSLRIGRQNIMKGEGFLFLEGTSGDGSRALYFNAFDLAYTQKKTKLEFIGISQPNKEKLLPLWHDRSRTLVEWDEQALGTYFTDNNSKNNTFESYYFYKKETRDRRASDHPQFQPDRHISTFGGRLVHRMENGWESDTELAVQWGHQRPTTVVRGLGGYGYVKKTWAGSSFSFGYFGLSGDDLDTKERNEGWDPLFSRWPGYSELYLLSLLKERGVGYWTNVGMWRTELLFAPHKKVNGRVTFYRMKSYQPFAGDPTIFSGGTRRGDMFQVRLDFNLDKHWRGHALYERMLPGSFYTHDTPGHFLRFEIIFQAVGHAGK